MSRGSIERRGKVWSFSVGVPVPDDFGEVKIRRRRIILGLYPQVRSWAQARALADDFLERHEIPKRRGGGTQIRFAAYAARFLKVHVSIMRKSSRKQFGSVIRTHLIPPLGKLPLPKITAALGSQVIAGLHAKGLSRATISNVRAIFLHIMAMAASEGLTLSRLTSKNVKLPKEAKPAKDPRFITPGELALLLGVGQIERRALYGVLGYLGLRIGEAIGLRWQDLDLQDATVRIRQSVVYGEVQALKTATSQADLPIPEPLLRHLCDYRDFCAAPAAGDTLTRGLLFVDDLGQPYLSDWLRTHWLHKDCKERGIPRAGFHAFRHGLPRTLLAAGVSPGIVQRLMRHATLEMTQKYLHTTADDLRAGVAAAFQRREARV